MCHPIRQYAKANKKNMKDYDLSKESSYLMFLDASNLCGWLMSQKLPMYVFGWRKELLKFEKEFIQTTMKTVRKGIYLDYPKLTYHSYLKE